MLDGQQAADHRVFRRPRRRCGRSATVRGASPRPLARGADGPTTASGWTNQPRRTAKYATSTETRGNPGCASAPDGGINADVTGLVKHWATQKCVSGRNGVASASAAGRRRGNGRPGRVREVVASHGDTGGGE